LEDGLFYGVDETTPLPLVGINVEVTQQTGFEMTGREIPGIQTRY
jgi:hypothetical protein